MKVVKWRRFSSQEVDGFKSEFTGSAEGKVIRIIDKIPGSTEKGKRKNTKNTIIDVNNTYSSAARVV